MILDAAIAELSAPRVPLALQDRSESGVTTPAPARTEPRTSCEGSRSRPPDHETETSELREQIRK
eukprot:5310113-Alexandrium_andersonii.AAC.1